MAAKISLWGKFEAVLTIYNRRVMRNIINGNNRRISGLKGGLCKQFENNLIHIAEVSEQTMGVIFVLLVTSLNYHALFTLEDANSFVEEKIQILARVDSLSYHICVLLSVNLAYFSPAQETIQ